MSTTTTQNASAQFPSPAQAKKVTKKNSESKTTTESKPKKPSLKEKHSRFLVSNYTLVQHLAAKGLLSEEAVETAYGEIKLFAPVEEQEAFYETYITESKTTKKTMKKFITQRNKPPKAPRKSRAKKAESAPSSGGAKEKKPRAKKTTKVDDDTNVDVVADNTAELVSELTAAATTVDSPPADSQTDTTTVPDAPKKARKPRTKKTDTNDGENKEKKPRGRKSKKDEAPPVENVVVQSVQEEVEEEEEIHTQEITIGDKLYLIDSDNNLYSHETHEQVGTFDSENNTVVAM